MLLWKNSKKRLLEPLSRFYLCLNDPENFEKKHLVAYTPEVSPRKNKKARSVRVLSSIYHSFGYYYFHLVYVIVIISTASIVFSVIGTIVVSLRTFKKKQKHSISFYYLYYFNLLKVNFVSLLFKFDIFDFLKI